MRGADANDLDLLTHGYDTPNKQDSKEAHGEALGAEEVRLTKMFYGWDPDAKFYVPDGVVEHFQKQFGRLGADFGIAWETQFLAYRKKYPALAEQIDCMQRRDLPEGWDSTLPFFPADAKGIATREVSGKVLNAIAERMPWLIGGAADPAPSTKTYLNFKHAGDFQSPDKAGNYHGRNLH